MIKSNKKKKRGVVFRTLLLVFISLILGGSVYFWNARNLTGNMLPMPFGYGAAVVLSGSMEPTLAVNDLIFIQKTDEYQIGDIVVYQEGKTLVVHRLIEIDGETVRTQGDANDTPDAPVGIASVRGRVTGRIPGVGIIVKAIKTPVGVIAILAAAVLLTELSYRKERRRDDDEIEKIKDEIRKLKEDRSN